MTSTTQPTTASTTLPRPDHLGVVGSSVATVDDDTRWVGDPSRSVADRPGDVARPAAPVDAGVGVDPLLRQGNSVYLAAHGLLHLACAAVAWGHAADALPRLSTGLSPTLDAAILIALGVTFCACSVLLLLGRHWRGPLTLATAGSAALCLTALPQSTVPLLVDGLVAVGLLASRPRR